MPFPEDKRNTKGFDKRPENINREGRPVGSKNRNTILKKWIELNTKLKNPITGNEEEGIVEDKIALALLSKALKGDVIAIKEIYDTLYGKIADKSETKVQGEIIINLKKGGSSEK